MELESFFSKNQMFTLKNTEKQPVIKEMTLKLEELGLIQNADRYYAQIIHRESLENTGIGRGFAIPHARTDSVSDLIILFGISNKSIEYNSYDGVPVNYLMLCIFPTEMSTKYLYLVSMMARIFSNREKAESIREAKTPAKIYAIFKREAKAYFDDISKESDVKLEKSEILAGVPTSNLDLLIRLDRLYKHLGDEDSKTVKTKIDELRKLIDNRSLTYYERMRNKCQTPFAVVEKSTCTGCHMQIPPMQMNQSRTSNNISICPHCGRFLIFL